MKKYAFSAIFLCLILSGCGKLEIVNHDVNLTLSWSIKYKVTGTIKNTTSHSCRDITLKIEYKDLTGELIGEELLPLDIIVGPNQVARFDIKTQHAPKDVEAYILSINSYNRI